ncbi:MAG: DUF4886 domain-containing protein [Clostridia bacterium]|nr:DUF4886 domain-containing protein [Clostridia bacterium]
MKKILCIGNSFSQDASRYVWGISRADGKEVKIVNLYIGGCDLARHYRNMMSENREYTFEINGMIKTGIRVSLKEALLLDDWDYVTLQQQSLQGADYDTYTPYLHALSDYVRTMCPKAKLMMFETWGYEEGSQKLASTEFATHEDMFRALHDAYGKAQKEIGAVGIIPGGKAISLATEMGGLPIYRDSYHMSFGFGRYLLGLLFYGTMIGNGIEENTFRDFDEPISEEEVAIAKKLATLALKADVK